MSASRHSGRGELGDERWFAGADDEKVRPVADEMLCQAYELVLSGWCQGAIAQDEAGHTIEPSSAFARRWSAPGALDRIWRRSELDPDLALNAFTCANLALAAVVSGVPQVWNDDEGRTLVQVLDALAEAAVKTRDPGSPLPAKPSGSRSS